jgi:hypothetical protein
MKQASVAQIVNLLYRRIAFGPPAQITPADQGLKPRRGDMFIDDLYTH